MSKLLKLRKITFLSLNRPAPLTDFDAARFRKCLQSWQIPSRLSHVRYRHLSDNSHLGRWVKTETWYHHTLISGEGWVHLEGDAGDRMFEQNLTPQLLPTLKFNWEIDQEARRRQVIGGMARLVEDGSEMLRDLVDYPFLGRATVYDE